MKKLLLITTTMAWLAGAAFIACSDATGREPQKATGQQAAPNEPSTTASNLISFKVDGVPVVTSGWNISRFVMGEGISLNITSNMHDDKRTVLFNLHGAQAGSYSLGPGSKTSGTAYGHYKPDYNDMLNAYSFESGTIVISSIDTVKGLLNGHFEGMVANAKGDKFVITEGKIQNGLLKPGITHY
jgi:hypothetical protein